ncbi:molybdopterin molybdotransferase MoeA [Varunaivibrio sulfuroxidans]|uniref:Molybdopterin molybdenumtransferase n=1 Tax=Varunaivibrio sulfuroxidans TaxID=1773489 RepID=A0A4R3JHC2_9PROT|nr:gephyrin-like molybdotransferase Glp [Varunaivibrio sulfuroxidans]TCS64180.1 molybdopterin molybdotransferase [Varunaivibrio sulfuroxidans]
MKTMISVAEAMEMILSGMPRLAGEHVTLPQALGRVLARDVTARLTQPFADVSSMDGYAVRAQDVAHVPVTLTRIGEAAAGGHFAGKIGAGETVRIFTGAPLPEGADAIVIQEVTETEGDSVVIKEVSTPGRFVRKRGLDFNEGDILLKAGTRMGPRELGLAAAMNAPWLSVVRKPRIAIVATGNEVVMPGDPLGANQIISSNSLLLQGFIEQWGGVALNLGIARDDETSLHALLDAARGADLLITIGGASVGDYDLVRKVLGDEGIDMGFYKVAMRPGKPLIFGHLGHTAVLGLPGNPVSVGVSSAVFLKPAMQTMMGMDTPLTRNAATPNDAVLGAPLGENDQRQDYLRASLSRDAQGALVAHPFTKQDSAMLARFAQADALIVRSPFAPSAQKGDRVKIIVIREA